MTVIPTSEKDTRAESVGRRMQSYLGEYFSSVRLFSRNARLYLLGSFLIGFNFSSFQLLLNLYLKEVGFLEGDIGMVQSYRALGMTLIAIPAGLLLSRVRLKPLLIVSCGLLAVFSFGLTTFTQMGYLIMFGLLAGMAISFFRVASGPFYMRNSTPTERTHLFSFSFATYLLAGIIGSYLAGNLVTLIGDMTGDIVVGYQYTLYIAIAVSLIALIPFALIRASAPSREENRISLTWGQLKRRGRFYIKISVANALIGMGAGLIIPFLNLYFRDRFGLPPDQIGFYYILLSLGMLVGTLSGPLLTPRLGLIRTIVFTQLASIPFMLALAYTHTLYLAVPAFVIRGGLMNLGTPISTNFGMELSEKSEQGLVNALLMISWTGSWMVSVAIGGHLIENFGYTVVLNIASGLYVASSAIYYFFFARVERRNSGRTGWHIPAETRM
jgi:predicted MFS family arabinose efflux permease